MNETTPPEDVDGRSVDDWLRTLASDGLDELATARVAKKLKFGRKRRKPPKIVIVGALVVAGATAAAAAKGVLPRLFSDPTPAVVKTPVKAKRPLPLPQPKAPEPTPDDTKLLQLALQKAELGDWTAVTELLKAPVDPDSMLGPELIVVTARAHIELKHCGWLAAEIDRLAENKNWADLQAELQSMFSGACSEGTSP